MSLVMLSQKSILLNMDFVLYSLSYQQYAYLLFSLYKCPIEQEHPLAMPNTIKEKNFITEKL